MFKVIHVINGIDDNGNTLGPRELWINKDCVLSIEAPEETDYREVHTVNGAFYTNPIFVEDTLEELLSKFDDKS